MDYGWVDRTGPQGSLTRYFPSPTWKTRNFWRQVHFITYTKKTQRKCTVSSCGIHFLHATGFSMSTFPNSLVFGLHHEWCLPQLPVSCLPNPVGEQLWTPCNQSYGHHGQTCPPPHSFPIDSLGILFWTTSIQCSTFRHKLFQKNIIFYSDLLVFIMASMNSSLGMSPLLFRSIFRKISVTLDFL